MEDIVGISTLGWWQAIMYDATVFQLDITMSLGVAYYRLQTQDMICSSLTRNLRQRIQIVQPRKRPERVQAFHILNPLTALIT